MHPNTQTLEKIYAAFAAGQFTKLLSHCSDKVTFQISGKSKLAGKYDAKTFVSEFAAKVFELSGGTLKTEIHDMFANDRHGIVLATESLMRGGKKVEFRTVHVWRFEGGKAVAWYEYPRDLYAFDEIWS